MKHPHASRAPAQSGARHFVCSLPPEGAEAFFGTARQEA